MAVKKLFGERVRELRRERGFSQEGFADECGLHRTYMSGIERGLRNVSIENVARIAAALGVPIGELFTWSKPPETQPGRGSRAGGRRKPSSSPAIRDPKNRPSTAS